MPGWLVFHQKIFHGSVKLALTNPDDGVLTISVVLRFLNRFRGQITTRPVWPFNTKCEITKSCSFLFWIWLSPDYGGWFDPEVLGFLVFFATDVLNNLILCQACPGTVGFSCFPLHEVILTVVTHEWLWSVELPSLFKGPPAQACNLGAQSLLNPKSNCWRT